jgi:hypothetical protein
MVTLEQFTKKIDRLNGMAGMTGLGAMYAFMHEMGAFNRFAIRLQLYLCGTRVGRCFGLPDLTDKQADEYLSVFAMYKGLDKVLNKVLNKRRGAD